LNFENLSPQPILLPAVTSVYNLISELNTNEAKISAGLTKEINLPTLFRHTTLFLGTTFTISETAVRLCRE
jgi:hypothetical protein